MRRSRLIAVTVASGAGALLLAAATEKPLRKPNTLYVPDHVLSVGGRKQLTFQSAVRDFAFSPRGDQIAVVGDARGNVRLQVFGPVEGGILGEELKVEVPGWGQDGLAWSPDGSAIAFESWVALGPSSGVRGSRSAALWLVRTADRQPRRLFSATALGSFAWEPDGKRIAVSFQAPAPDAPKISRRDIAIVSVEDASSRNVGEWGEDLRFTPDGKFLSCRVATEESDGAGVFERVQFNIETGEKSRRSESAPAQDTHLSPDGSRIAQPSPGGNDLAVRDLQSHRMTRLTWNAASKFAAWSPDSQMIAYVRDYPMNDDRRETVKTGPTLWMVAAAGPDIGRQVLLSHVVDRSRPVRWSPDGEAIAFVVDGDLRVLFLDSRALNVIEKMALGFVVNENDAVREEALSNMRQIALAAVMYAQDYDECFPPPASSIPDLLSPYLRSREVFSHPLQPDRFIFRYLLGSEHCLDDIEDEAATPIAVLDLGPDWEVIGYADGHVKGRPK